MSDHGCGRCDAGRHIGELCAVAGQLDRFGICEVELGLLQVLRDVDEHGARTAGARDVEGLVDCARNVLDGLDKKRVLDDWHHDAGDVGLLEGVGANQVRGHLSRNCDERGRVKERIGNWRNEVGRAGAAGCDADANLAGRTRIALRHVASALLVSHEHVLD